MSLIKALKKGQRAFFLLLALFPRAAIGADDWGGLQMAGAADLVTEWGFKDANKDNKLEARTIELMLFGPTDHLFEGRISFAAHLYNGEQNLAVHEAFIKSSKLIPRTRFQIGQFFIGVGRLNDIHQHDWPFIQAPLTQETFFDGEGIIDSGLQFSWLAPLPFFLDVTAGVTNGWRITHSHGDEGEKPKVPTHYAKFEFYSPLWSDGGLLWALNYMARKDADKAWMVLTGAHAVAKWRSGKVLRLLVQSELWNRLTNPEAAESQNELGGYLFVDYGWSSTIRTGARFDYLTNLDLKDITGSPVSNYEMEMSPELTWAPSEFAKFRVGYAYKRSGQELLPTRHEHQINLQSVFILGAHPAHEF